MVDDDDDAELNEMNGIRDMGSKDFQEKIPMDDKYTDIVFDPQ